MSSEGQSEANLAEFAPDSDDIGPILAGFGPDFVRHVLAGVCIALSTLGAQHGEAICGHRGGSRTPNAMPSVESRRCA